jgi:hypothetical protein
LAAILGNPSRAAALSRGGRSAASGKARMKITKRRQPLDFGASNDDGRGPKPAAPETAKAKPADRTARAEPAQPQPDQPQSSEAPRAQAAPALRPAAAVGAAPAAWPLYLTAFAVAVLWALGPIAFAMGYRSAVAPLTDAKFAFLVFALLAVGPAVLVFGVAYFVRQGQLLAAEARRAREREAELLSPALRAAAEAGDVTQGVREEIARAAAAADTARESLLALRQALAAEAAGLAEAAQGSLAAAQTLSGQLGEQRGGMDTLSRTLDAQAARVVGAFDAQARRLAEAAEAADSRLRDAEAVLAARAVAFTAAAGDAGDTVRGASDDLARHIARLETAGSGLVEQVRAVEGGLSEQRAALLTLADALRADHETFSAEAEVHAIRLDSFIGETRRAAGEMSEQAVQAGETLRSLISEAAGRFGELAQAVAREREAFGDSAGQSLAAVTRAAAEQRARLEADNREAIQALARAAEETRDAAGRHAAAAREQVDQL